MTPMMPHSLPALAVCMTALTGAGGATAVQAEPWRCSFTAECIASEPCAETDWSVDLIAADHEGQLFLSSVSGDDPVTRLSPPQTRLPAAYAGPDRLLTLDTDGTAILTLHLGVALTYFGSCEELE